MQLKPEHFTPADLPTFLQLAGQEHWICDQWEFDFLLRLPVASCLVIRHHDLPRAFITALSYGHSGWIGNLLVQPAYRRQGLARLLMQTAIDELDAAGVSSIWLTASDEGAPLYSSLGFRPVDRIERWAGTGSGMPPVAPRSGTLHTLNKMDALGWGSPRAALIAEKARLGQTWLNEGGFLIRQHTAQGMQIGPWCGTADAAEELFSAALAIAPSNRCRLDLPTANNRASELVSAHNFTCQGTALLMGRGDTTGYDPRRLFALATMGSIG